MSDLQRVIDEAAGQLAHAKQAASCTVVLSTSEAQLLLDAAQLTEPLRERCELLGRALNAMWSLVTEEDQQAITALLDAPYGPGKTRPAATLVQHFEGV